MSKPVPLPDRDSSPYWDAARRHRLMLPKCRACGRLWFPPKPRCPICLSEQMDWTEVSGHGAIYSYCVMGMNLVPGFVLPYVIAVVELDDAPGCRLTANIVDCPAEAVQIGLPVEVVFEDRTAEVTLPQFRLLQPYDAR
jgi:uncharacterized protein